MEFYNVEMKGKFKLEKKESFPTFDADDEGMLFYYNNNIYFSDSTAQAVLGGGGGGGGGDAITLNGQTGSYYLCRNNHTGTNNADQLQGQTGSYYLCKDNHTGLTDLNAVSGILDLEHGGTGVSDSTSFISNLDARYGRLDSDNTWTGDQYYGTALNYFDTGDFIHRQSYSGICMYNPTCGVGGYCTVLTIGGGVRTRGAYGQTACVIPGQVHSYYMSCSSGSPGCGINSFYSNRCYGVCTHCYSANVLINNSPTGAGTGLEICNCGCCSAIWARSCSSCPTIYSQALGGGFAVTGNTAYQNVSSKNLKHLECTCLSNCVRKQPLSIYRYYWEDSNNAGFNMSIGPTAEDFHKTFNLDNANDGEKYDSVWSIDGAALGLSVENLKEIDRLKKIVLELYSCIQKLEGVEV